MALVRTIANSVLLAAVATILGSNNIDRVGVVAFSASSSARALSVGTRSDRGRGIPALFADQPQHKQCSMEHPLSVESTLPVEQSERARRQTTTTTLAVSFAIAMATASTTLPVEQANAYVPADYASDTVQTSIKELQAAKGNSAETFKVYESIAAIITEGKGVGGQINYKGVELERGYVADEDTSIYNPGLSLLTESEKERLVEGVIDVRKAGLQSKQWSEENEYAYQFLRGKLDPYHMYELSGFLSIVPYYGAAIYVVVTAIQQLFRDAFQIAYLVGAAAFFAPIIGLVLLGPQ